MRRRGVLASVGVGLAGCSSLTGTPTPTAEPPHRGDDTLPLGDPSDYAYTHLKASRNRVVSGTAGQGALEPVDVSFDAAVRWIVAVTKGDGAEWIALTEAGGVRRVPIAAGGTGTTRRGGDPLPRGAPPVVARRDDRRVYGPVPGGSTLTHGLPLSPSTGAFVTEDRRLVHRSSDGDEFVVSEALPDARLSRVDADRFAVLAGATDDYRHGALGDRLEARKLVVSDVSDGTVRREYEAPTERVFEAIGPLVAPFAGLDPALVVAETGESAGARLVAFGPDGERFAGPPVGAGFRWRHPLCVAPFAPDGVAELAVVKTPHIGGTVEFYRREGDRLAIAASHEGASSHANGSRNLDGAVAADIDGNGRPELVVPDDTRSELQILRRTGSGVERVDSLPIGGRITSNVFAIATDVGLQVGVARGETLRLWR